MNDANKRSRGRNQKGGNPPSGPDALTDQSHALRAGRDKPATARRSHLTPDESTRDAGRDDRRSGSESGKS